MAGLIRALFGGRARPPDPDPLPGQGGYQLPPGPAGQTGFPGSTGQVRTFQGRNPRAVKIRADTNTGWEAGLSGARTDQASYRGDIPGAAVRGPRATAPVTIPNTTIITGMQSTPGTLAGGPVMRNQPGAVIAGGNPLGDAQAAGGHSQFDTRTPGPMREPIIGVGAPGSNNVRNQIAQRFKAAPGQIHTYSSAPRPDQAPPSTRGSDGNVHPERVTQMVSVPSRLVLFGGGSQTWSVQRRMPYSGRGDGARGAELSGFRYYATGQEQAFWNAGQGDYGVARLQGSGNKRPVSFTEPAPWTANYYDTTESVGTIGAPGTPGQAPNLVYVSPSAGRAGNGTGRTG